MFLGMAFRDSTQGESSSFEGAAEVTEITRDPGSDCDPDPMSSVRNSRITCDSGQK
jgi:hypothetical protein